MRSYGANFAAAIAGTALDFFVTAVFHFTTARGDVYVSDRPVTIGGQVHNPVVAVGGWGDLQSVLPRDFQTLDAKTVEFSFINYPVDSQAPAFVGERFSDVLASEAEATEVDLYQNVKVGATIYQEKLTTLIVQGPTTWSLQSGKATLRVLYEKYFLKNFLRAVTVEEYPRLRAADEGALIPHAIGPIAKLAKGIVVDKDRGIIFFAESPSQGQIQSIEKVYYDGHELSDQDIRGETSSLAVQQIFAMDGGTFDGGFVIHTGNHFLSDETVKLSGASGGYNSITQGFKIPPIVNPRLTHIDAAAVGTVGTPGALGVKVRKIRPDASIPPSASPLRPGNNLPNQELLSRFVERFADAVPGGLIDTDGISVDPGATYYASVYQYSNADDSNYNFVELNPPASPQTDLFPVGNAILEDGGGDFSDSGKQMQVSIGLKGDTGGISPDAGDWSNGDPFNQTEADFTMAKKRGLLTVGFDISKARLALALETFNWGITGASLSDSHPLTVELIAGNGLTSEGGSVIETFTVTPSQMGTAIQQSTTLGLRAPVVTKFSKPTLLLPGRYWLRYLADELSTVGASQPDQRLSMFMGRSSGSPPTTGWSASGAEQIIPAHSYSSRMGSPTRSPNEPYFNVDFGIRVAKLVKRESIEDSDTSGYMSPPWTNVPHYVADDPSERERVALIDMRITDYTDFTDSIPDEADIRAELVGSEPYGFNSPDRVIHLVAHRAGVPEARIDLAGSFAAARTFYATAPGPYIFDGMIRDQIDFKALLIKLAYEARSVVDWNIDQLKLKVLPNSPGTPVKTITPAAILPQGIVPRLTVTRSDPKDILNVIAPKYNRDWSDDGVLYKKTLSGRDANSINLYGRREAPDDRFQFDFIVGKTMMTNVGGFILKRNAQPIKTVEVAVKLPYLDVETDDQLSFSGV